MEKLALQKDPLYFVYKKYTRNSKRECSKAQFWIRKTQQRQPLHKLISKFVSHHTNNERNNCAEITTFYNFLQNRLSLHVCLMKKFEYYFSIVPASNFLSK